jgi:molybdate transport repressor ModE-like protein
LGPRFESSSERKRLWGVEIRHLAALAAVAREGSIRRAAHRLGYAQSAVSQQLAELEEAVGARLVERVRGAGQVRLTDAGRLLLRHAESILARVLAARADLTALNRPGLRVGLDGAIAACLLPRILETLGVEAARRISLDESGDEAGLLDALHSGRLDMTFADLPLPEGPFAWDELLSDPCVLLVPSRSPLAERPGAPSLREVAQLPLVARTGSRFQERVDDALAAHGGRPLPIRRVEFDWGVHALVASEYGVAVLPRLNVDAADQHTVAVDLGDVLPPRRLGLVWNRERRLHPDGMRFKAAAAGAAARLRREPLLRSLPSAGTNG